MIRVTKVIYSVEENKEMITLNDLRICDNCGNVYSSKVGIKIINRCPACDLWKKGKAL